MKIAIQLMVLGGLLMVFPNKGQAIPSFARQTGMSCATCHTVFPELTSFGRNFKMSGYTLGVVKKISEIKGDDTRLSINESLPVSAMLMVSHSLVAAQADSSTVQAGSDGKGSIQFPAQFSLFFAGALSPKLGTFIQATYAPGGGFVLDNSDVRYVNKFDLAGTELLLGVDLNNNPTVQDVWNTVPAWGFPYSTSDLTLSPLASTQIDGALSQGVASLGTYLYWNNLLYAEISAYRSAPQGGTPDKVIQGFAPYWRVALQQDLDNHSFEVGGFGLGQQTLSTDPANVQSNPADNYTDYAVDAQYQYVGEDHILTAQAVWIHETQTYNGLSAVDAPVPYPAGVPANFSNDLQTSRITGTYYYQRTLGCSLGYFSTQGSSDPGIYAAAKVIGSASGSSNTNGYIAELNYLPWLNTKFSLQYTNFNEFNGGDKNYDGNGRNAGDNDTTMLMAWLMY